MAITKNEVQVTWSAANSLSVSAASAATSDAIAIANTCVELAAQVKADNDGTPASGDTIDFFLVDTLGDPDGTGTDEHASANHGRFLYRLDTNVEDAAISPAIRIPVSKAVKIRAENNSSGRAITVSATLRETRA